MTDYNGKAVPQQSCSDQSSYDDLCARLKTSCYLAFDDGTNDYATAEEAAAAIRELEARVGELQNTAVLSKAAYEGVSSLLLDVQQDCIKERARAETAETALAAMTAKRNGTERALAALTIENEAAEAQVAALTARVEGLTGAADYILDGMGIDAPDYVIDPDDDFLDAANSEWVRDTLTRLAAALSATTEEDNGLV